MKIAISKYLLFSVILGMLSSCGDTPQKQDEDKMTYGEIALQESVEPIRPGEPGIRPFWNKYSKRFIYAPAFDFKPVEGAKNYKFELTSVEGAQKFEFESEEPYAPLSPVWANMPVDNYKLTVVGLSPEGDSLGVSGEREFYRAAPFDGIYHEPVLPYDASAKLALETLLEKDYIQHWLTHKSPDPDYGWYRYPTKIYSALVIGAITQAKLQPNTEVAETSLELARIVADSLIALNFPKGSPLEYFPPTYHGYPQFFEGKDTHMNYDRTMVPYAADAGNAYLDLYDMVGDDKYLEAAKLIAQTYKKTQLENGSWYLYVNNKTGEPIESNITIPTSTVNYLNRLKKDYGVEGYEEVAERALEWIMENPVETFNWQGQFEDIAASEPYENHSREQASDLAMYLLNNKPGDKESLKLAEDLIRFSEDQFVIWEKPNPKPDNGKVNKGSLPQNWITPSVQEQYAYYRPISRSAGIMIDTFYEAYRVTGKEIYLAKAKSIANTFTVVQDAHDGDYPTHFTKYEMNFWLNNAIYPAKVMMNFSRNLEQLPQNK